MHCFRTTNFKTLNQINNRYGTPLLPKNALRKGEKRHLNSKKKFENQNFMLILLCLYLSHSIRVMS